MLYIVTGGSGSGKSEYAEQTAVQCRNRNGGTLWYLATMRIWDDEGRKRVERHRRMRAAKGFETIERYTGLETLELEERFEESNSAGLDAEQENDSLKRWESCRVAQKPVLLLECMSNLVLNEFYAQENGAQERILQGIKRLQNQCHDLIIVTNEIFSDGVTYDMESERYKELLGRINRELGVAVLLCEHRLEDVFQRADRVLLMKQVSIISDDTTENLTFALHRDPTASRIYLG